MDFRRMTEGEDRWNQDTFNSRSGVPWEPIPGQPGQIELKVRVNMPDQDAPIIVHVLVAAKDPIM